MRPIFTMAFSDPKQVIRECAIADGSMVADFGTGSGHYAMAAAQAVGARGRVYAVDIQKELLARLKKEALAKHLGNLEVLWGDIEAEGGSKLRSSMVDVVIMANALFQMHHRNASLQEAKRVLKPGGTLVFVEWQDSYGGMGPAPSEVVQEAVARDLLTRAGFSVERSLRNAGEHHYGFIARKN